MPTECSADLYGFAAVERRQVVASFDGGTVTSDAGALLLGQADQAVGMMGRLAGCFRDARDPDLVEHEVTTLVGQRVFGLCLGYEDLNDHDQLRHDPVMGVLAGKLAPRRHQKCAAVAGKSTLNRLELSAPEPSRYKKISYIDSAIETLMVDLFLEAHAKPPEEIVLDLDATDDPLHGMQEGRFFHGFYGHYCYLPLYITCGDHLLGSKLRVSNIDASAGALEEVVRITGQIRGRWPGVKIVLRADSGFARDETMTWCERNGVDFIFGLARNARLVDMISAEMDEAKAASEADGGRPARKFKELTYRTLKSWDRARRVVAKAEWTSDKANPRFVVTSVDPKDCNAQRLYEERYCARGDMENRIKECQLDLFADRTSTATFRANQMRLWFASFAYILMCALRRALAGSQLASASCGQLRLKLLKIGALITLSVRRIKIAMNSACPFQREWALAYANLRTQAA